MEPWRLARKKGRVIGEFTCKKITGLTHVGKTGSWEPECLNVMAPGSYYKPADELLKAACMSKEAAEKYLKGRDGYGWHISDLKIYDKPRDLDEFSRFGFLEWADQIAFVEIGVVKITNRLKAT